MKREVQRLFGGGLNLLAPTDKTPEGDAIDLLNFRVDQAGVLRGVEGFTELYSVSLGGGFCDIILPVWNGTAFDLWFFAGTNLYKNGSAIGTLSTIQPWRAMIYLQGNIWGLAANSNTTSATYQSFRLDGTTPKSWLPPPPASALTAGTTGVTGANYPSGEYQYYVTFVNDVGLETIAGPASTPYTTLSPGEEIALSGIPVSGDTSVVARNIYRSGGTLGAIYEVTQIANNTSTTYTDTSSDLDLTLLDIVLSALNEPPPPAGGLVGPYFNRLLAYRSLANPNRMWWTQNGIWTWPGSGVLSGNPNEPGNWVDVGSSDDPIVNVVLHPSVAIIYKSRSIWRLQGDPDTGILEECSAPLGTLISAWETSGSNFFGSPHGAVAAGAIDFFLAQDGSYKFDLDSAGKVSEKLDPIFLGTGLPQLGASDLTTATFYVSPSDPPQMIAYLNGIVLISDSDSVSAYQYHVEAQRWNRFEATIGPITAIGYTGSYGLYYAGFANGQIGVSSFRDFGNSYAYQTRFLDQGMPDNPKEYVELVVDIELNGSAATVYAFYDNGGSSPGAKSASVVGTISGTVRKKVHISLGPDGVLGTNISVRIEIAGAGTSGSPIALPAIHGVFIYYYPEARQTYSITLRPFNPGPGVWQIKELAYDINAAANVTAKLLTDLPGNELTLRETDTITAHSYRRNYELPQSSIWEGRTFQVMLDASGLFQIYAARMAVRHVGVYIEDYEAAAGFVWDSMEQSFSGDANLIKQARELEIEADLNASVTVTLLSDLPGDTETSAFSGTITGTGAGRRFFRIPLTAGVIGRLYRLQLSGTHGYKLYSARIELLPIGIYIEAYEAAAGAVWDSNVTPLDSEGDKIFDQFRIEAIAAGTLTLTIYTDLPGEELTLRSTTTVSGSGRRWFTWELPAGLHGRLFQSQVSSTAAFQLFHALVTVRKIGRYFADSVSDQYRALAQDFGSERIKLCKKLEVDIETNGTVTLTLSTEVSGVTFSTTIATTAGVRSTFKIPLPPNIRGRLWTLNLTTATWGRLYAVRAWIRTVGEAGDWAWQNFAVEVSEELPHAVELPVRPTPAQWDWTPFPVEPTSSEWKWLDIPLIDETVDS